MFFFNQQSYVCVVSSSLREGGTFVPLSSTGVAALIRSTVSVLLIIAVKKS